MRRKAVVLDVAGVMKATEKVQQRGILSEKVVIYVEIHIFLLSEWLNRLWIAKCCWMQVLVDM